MKAGDRIGDIPAAAQADPLILAGTEPLWHAPACHPRIGLQPDNGALHHLPFRSKTEVQPVHPCRPRPSCNLCPGFQFYYRHRVHSHCPGQAVPCCHSEARMDCSRPTSLSVESAGVCQQAATLMLRGIYARVEHSILRKSASTSFVTDRIHRPLRSSFSGSCYAARNRHHAFSCTC